MKTGLSKFFILCFCVFLAGRIFAQEKKLSRVSVQGNKFVTDKGQIIIFRGLDTSDPDKLLKDGHWNRQYFEIANGWGANIVRFPVHPRAWRGQGRENYIKLLDQGVQWATELGMYVIIDWHSIGNLKSELFTDPMYETSKKETFEFWRTMAHHYSGNTTVAFFELFNEPILRDDQMVFCLGTCTWGQWKDIVEEMIAIVRGNGSKAIPLVAGFNWAYDLTPVANDPVNAEGIGYVSHPYPGKREKPWIADWEKDWGFVADKYPVFLTEMGYCDGPPSMFGCDDESYGDAITGYCNKKGISYTVWALDPDWSCMVIKDWNFTPTRGGIYFRNVMQKANHLPRF
jgi:endoglucanase